jgi:hypothetical protein
MPSRIVEQMWGAARLMLSPEYLIDKLLDWIDELSGVGATAAAQGGRLVTSEVPTESLLGAGST